jgi:hypothetical protein
VVVDPFTTHAEQLGKANAHVVQVPVALLKKVPAVEQTQAPLVFLNPVPQVVQFVPALQAAQPGGHGAQAMLPFQEPGLGTP